MNFWGFLSIATVAGMAFTMFVLYLGHKKAMKQMDLDASKYSNKKTEG